MIGSTMIGTTAVMPAPSIIPDPEVPTMKSMTIIADAIATIIEIIRRHHPRRRGCTKIVGTRPGRATLAPGHLTLPIQKVATRSVGPDLGRVTRAPGRAPAQDLALSGPSLRRIRTTSSARVRRGCTKAARIRPRPAMRCTKVEILII